MKTKQFYVTMIDRFMSGWGKAEYKKNRLTIACDSLAIAEGIAQAARQRDEMKFIRITETKPVRKAGEIQTEKTMNDLWGPWFACLPCDKEYSVVCRQRDAIGEFSTKIFLASFPRHAQFLANMAGYEVRCVMGD